MLLLRLHILTLAQFSAPRLEGRDLVKTLSHRDELNRDLASRKLVHPQIALIHRRDQP